MERRKLILILDTSNQTNNTYCAAPLCRYEFLNNSGVVGGGGGGSSPDDVTNSEVTVSSPSSSTASVPSAATVTTASSRAVRIRPEVREQHCKTLRLALHVWLDQYPEDFKEPPNYPCLNQLEAFTQRIMPGSELDEKVGV